VIELLEEFRSKTPKCLRELAQKDELRLQPAVQHALIEAAAEIESSEQAYAALLRDVGELRAKLARTTEQLREVEGSH
jgi:hypothetical protein